MRVKRFGVLLLAIGLVAAACGDDDDDGASSGDATEPSGAAASVPAQTTASAGTAGGDTATTAAADTASTSGPAPSGEPIVVGMMSQDSGPRMQPRYADGVAAWVDRVNEEGGIGGRPVEFQRCDNAADPERADECARQLADNPNLLVVSSMGGFDGPVGLPIYEEAGLGVISSTAFTPPEQTSANEIVLNGSLIASYPAMMTYFHDEGAETMSIIHLDAASTVEAIARYQRIAEEIGLELLATVPVAPDLADYLPAVTAATEGDPDLILTQALPPQMLGILESLETVGNDAPVISTSGPLGPDILTLAAAQDRLYFESDVAEVTEEDPNIDDYEYLEERFNGDMTDQNVLGFIVGRAFQQAIEGGGGADATRATVLDFVQNGTFVDLPFMPPSISRADAPAEYPAMANVTTFIVRPDGEGGKVYVSDRLTPTIL